MTMKRVYVIYTPLAEISEFPLFLNPGFTRLFLTPNIECAKFRRKTSNLLYKEEP